ncbi:MAG: bifunctional isocitrate dehydrogenase kinase/phosphatase [Actinobacteria bacterium]|nr:bifunctional isocitrate dehydrogenase kinase/phosphatase [Actinomycetota bacterium]
MEVEATRAEAAERIAQVLLEGFDKHYWLFREVAAHGKQRFEAGDWAGQQQAVKERIRFYDLRVRECVDRVRAEFDVEHLGDAVWQEAKRHFIGLLFEHRRPELAETFFNSVTTRILHRTYMHNDFIFVRAAISTEFIESDPPNYRSYYPAEIGLRRTLMQALEDFAWALPFEDLERDARLVVAALHEHLGEWPAGQPNLQIQILGSPFYRNKAAYVIGKVVNGNEETPFVLPVLRTPETALAIDAVLLDAEEISVLFSLSRSYFLVDMDVPSGYVQFLQNLMPTKPRSELYTSLGLGRQGKTLFYRDLLQHLHHSRDLFVEAPGTRGQVMHVFNLPSYPYVFKLIKDVFGPSKDTDRATVMGKFQMVKDVDRVGRMADAIEFTNLALPLDRFAPELLEQLSELAPSVIEIDGESLVLKHCYVERRMTPLNIFLETATPEQLEHAVKEYGDAIRELAIANVFPGDMLWRNFGVTRHGRVVFYDYDEIEYLTDCTFRRIPEPPTPEAELSGEVWHPVAPRDIFPEEFGSFLLGEPRVREAFLRHHADLLTPDFWQECQRRVAAGEVVDFFPYREASRFSNRTALAPSTDGEPDARSTASVS